MSKKTTAAQPPADQPKLGRPPIAPERRRTCIVRTRLTVAELTEVARAARRAGLTLGVYLRERVVSPARTRNQSMPPAVSAPDLLPHVELALRQAVRGIVATAAGRFRAEHVQLALSQSSDWELNNPAALQAIEHEIACLAVQGELVLVEPGVYQRATRAD